MELTILQTQVKDLFEQGLSTGEIATKLSKAPSGISAVLDRIYGKNRPKQKNNKIVKRKYTLNDRFFQTIDTEEKAYFLGFIYADGCLSGTSNNMQLFLQERDKDILNKLNSIIGSNKPLRFLKGGEIKGFKNLQKTYYRQNQYGLIICSTRLREDLLKIGLTTKKSLTLTFPTCIPDTLMNHFIRGYFDGDGTVNKIGIGKHRTCCAFSLLSTESFCNSIHLILKKVVNSGRVFKPTINSKVFEYSLTGRLQVLKLYTYLYNNATIYLERKKETFEKWKNMKIYGKREVC